jgi:hypothetical protein
LGDALELACPALVSRATLVNLELLWAEINQNRKFLQVFAKLDWVEGWSVVKKQQKVRGGRLEQHRRIGRIGVLRVA